MEVSGQVHAPTALYPQERLGTQCTGRWVGPRAGLDRCGKSRPHRDSDPRTVKPVTSRYTDYATRPTRIKCFIFEIPTFVTALPVQNNHEELDITACLTSKYRINHANYINGKLLSVTCQQCNAAWFIGKTKFFLNKFRVCKSVHLHTFKLINTN
jgi:hypothetical protein